MCRAEEALSLFNKDAVMGLVEAAVSRDRPAGLGLLPLPGLRDFRQRDLGLGLQLGRFDQVSVELGRKGLIRSKRRRVSGFKAP